MQLIQTAILPASVVVALSGCRLRTPASAPDALPEGRKIIGVAQPYDAQMLDDAALAASMTERREAGWDIARRALKLVELAGADQLPAALSEAERRWLETRRSAAARHWNLLTDWTAEALRHRA